MDKYKLPSVNAATTVHVQLANCFYDRFTLVKLCLSAQISLGTDSRIGILGTDSKTHLFGNRSVFEMNGIVRIFFSLTPLHFRINGLPFIQRRHNCAPLEVFGLVLRIALFFGKSLWFARNKHNCALLSGSTYLWKLLLLKKQQRFGQLVSRQIN